MRRRPALLGVMAALCCVMLAGCSGGNGGVLSDSQIKGLLPETITSYYLDDEYRTQEVADVNVVRASVDGKTSSIECEITLKDPCLERKVFANLNARNYDVGGWQIDSWTPYKDEEIIVAPPIGSNEADSYMSAYGFYNLQTDFESTSMLNLGIYEKLYRVNESHSYADFSGTAVYKATLDYSAASNSRCAMCGWRGEGDLSGVAVGWNISGHWSGVETNAESDPYYFGRLPNKIEFDLSYPGTGDSITGGGAFYYPSVYPGTSERTGEYGSYACDYAKIYWSEGSSPADARLDVNVEAGSKTIRFRFTADSVTASCNSLDHTPEFACSR